MSMTHKKLMAKRTRANLKRKHKRYQPDTQHKSQPTQPETLTL